MASSTTMTVRMSEAVKAKLGTLAEKTQRTQSFLAERAIAGYVDRELEIVDAVERGRDDFRTGNIVSNEEALRQLRETVAKYET
ncbi:CopG family ribbon-helix-helix protein [soil metagenome]